MTQVKGDFIVIDFNLYKKMCDWNGKKYVPFTERRTRSVPKRPVRLLNG